MAIFHETTNEVICKVVYHGAGKCGKTTSLMYMNHHLPENQRGRFVTLETPTERTLFFDFLPVITKARGFKFRHLLYATPGQEYYDASRKLVLKGVDAIVFVVDSQRDRMQDNWEAYELLEKNLKSLGQPLENIPMVIQYNKRDLSGVIPLEDAERKFNGRHLLSFPAVARTGQGVYETFLTIAKMALTRLAIPGEEARKGELFRSLVIGTDDAVHFRNQLSRLNQEGGAVGSLLVDESTGVIASHGRIPSDNFESLGALLACNFTAAHELASNLSGSSFAGIMQIGKKWVMRATRVDQRRFLVLVCEKGFSYKKLNNAVTYFRGPLEGYLKRVDTMSPNRLSRFSGLLSSVTEIGIAGKTQA